MNGGQEGAQKHLHQKGPPSFGGTNQGLSFPQLPSSANLPWREGGEETGSVSTSARLRDAHS